MSACLAAVMQSPGGLGGRQPRVSSCNRGGQASASQPAPRSSGRSSVRCRASTSAPAADNRRVKLSFKIPYRCSFGQEVALVGNASEMGEWNVQGGVSLKWTEGDVWTVEFEVETGANLELEYKYVIRNSAGGDVVYWKPGDNYQIKVPVLLEQERAIAEGVLVRDAWDGSIQDISVEVSDLTPGAPEWSPEEEFQTMQAAVNRALTELDTLVASSMEGVEGKDPTSSDLLNADRVVAAAARKAMQLQGALSAAASLQNLPDTTTPGY